MHVHSAQMCVFPVSFPVDLLCTAIVVNPPERKLAKPTSMQCSGLFGRPTVWFIQHIFSILLFGIIKITRLLRNTKLSMAFHFYFETKQEKTDCNSEIKPAVHNAQGWDLSVLCPVATY